MAISPLQLSYSVFDLVHVEALTAYEWGEEAEPEPEVDVRVARSPEDDDEGWAVWVTIQIAREAKPTPPYAVTLSVFGTFEISRDFGSEDEITQVVAVNGASMLYSAAREFLLGLTARGPNMEYMLPSYDFRHHTFQVLEPDQVGQAGASTSHEIAEDV